jgi:hypothetical protein
MTTETATTLRPMTETGTVVFESRSLSFRVVSNPRNSSTGHTVEEVFELKEIPPKKQVPLVTICFLERASSWWQNYKYRR